MNLETVPITIMRYFPVKKKSLVGVFNFSLGDLRIYDCSLFEKDGRRFMTFPQKEVIKDGKREYFPMVTMDRPIKEMLCKRILDALDDFIAKTDAETDAAAPDFLL